jgi:hypothetical protein
MMLNVVHIDAAGCNVQTTGQAVAFFMLPPIYYHPNHNTTSFDTLSEEATNPISTKVLTIELGGKDHDKDETKLKTCPETLPEKSNEFQGQTRHGGKSISGTWHSPCGHGQWEVAYGLHRCVPAL